MPANRPAMVNQLHEIWTRLSWSQRANMFIFTFLGMALIGSLVYFMNRVDYKPLASDLSPETASEIVANLKAENIIYELRDNGTSIAVKASPSELAELKLTYGGSAMISSGRVGMGIFDQNQFGMTDFTENINLQRALEGELARTIEDLKGVVWARVHLHIAKKTLYSEDEEETTASVVVKLRPGAELIKVQIGGIKAILQGQVGGLSARNIFIVDNDAKLLTPMADSGDSDNNEMETSYREKKEKEMASRVMSILGPLVGKEKVKVSTSIDMDFSTSEQLEEMYNPNAPAVLSQQKSAERSGPSNSTMPSGVPGIESNLTSPTMPSTGTLSEQTRQSESTNYDYSKTVRHTVQPKGMVQRISVAVILDHKTIYKQSEEGETTSTREPISPEDLDDYRDLVLAAVGFDEKRGDVVTIENKPFFTDTRPVEPLAEEPFYVKWRGYIIPGMKYLAFITLFLLVYMIFLRPMRRRVSQALSTAALSTGGATEARLPGKQNTAALPEGDTAGAIEAPENDNYAAGIPSSSSDNYLSLEASDEQIERELMQEANMVDAGNRKYAAMKNRLVNKAKKDPEMVSQIIRSVLRERI